MSQVGTERPAIAGRISPPPAGGRPWGFPKLLYVIAWCGAVVGLLYNRPGTAAPLRVELTNQAAVKSPETAAVFWQTRLEPVAGAPSVHAATLTQLPNGDLLAAWFGGSREGAKDVSIYAATWNHQTERWGPARRLVDADEASRELGRYVKKLGNPVLHCDRNGRTWLYYVTVSLGGWSGSSISVKYSDDGGYSWSESDRLVTSPFLNISTLVRCLPLELDNGEQLLPVYHELLTKYGELLHLSADGKLIDKYRMGTGSSLQASVVAQDEQRLLAFHRSQGTPAARVLANRSADGGVTWNDVATLDLPNPNSAISVARRPGGGYVMALNASETQRQALSLAVSMDGRDWRVTRTLPVHPTGLESSYPTLLVGDCGRYHLVYTWGREQICHTYFNDAWLEGAE